MLIAPVIDTRQKVRGNRGGQQQKTSAQYGAQGHGAIKAYQGNSKQDHAAANGASL